MTIYKILVLSIMMILGLNFNVYAQSEEVSGVEISCPVYYENEQIIFKNNNDEVINTIIYDNEVYLPLNGISNLMGRQVGWNEERNCIEITEDIYNDSKIVKYLSNHYIPYTEQNITFTKEKDVRVTYNNSLVNLKDNDDYKSYIMSYNNTYYISVEPCRYLYFIDVELDNNKLYIKNNCTLQELKKEYFDLVFNENPINEIIELNTKLNNIDELDILGDYISSLYFYGESSNYFKGCRLDYNTHKYILSINPYSIKDKILNNVNSDTTNYIFEISKTIPINSSMSDVDKVKALNRWIIDNYVYDEIRAEVNLKGLIRSKYAICGGYSELFRELGEFYGLDAESVSSRIGPEGNVGAHAWNKVLINGEWVYVDVCWNDDAYNPEKYLFLTEEEMNYYHNLY